MAGDRPELVADAPSDDRARRGREVRRAVLVLGGIVGTVFLAWLAGEAVRAYLHAVHKRPAAAAIGAGPTTLPAKPPQSLAELIAAPLAGTGLVPSDGDPAGLAPPPGAKRLYGFVRRLTDQAEQQARYEVAAGRDEIVAHYDKAMAARGLRKLKDATDPTGRRMAIYRGSDGYATVALRTDRQEAKMVIVVVTVVTPARPQESR